MGDLSIFEETTDCINLFKGFHDVFDPDEHFDGAQIRFVAEEQAARFRIWAGTFGVFAKEHGSLDYRLRDNENIKQTMLDQLIGCQSSLERMIRLARNEELYAPSQPHDFSELDLGLNNSATTSSTMPSIDDCSTRSATYYGSDPALAEDIRDVEQAIDRLYRMSAIIRSQSFTGHGIKAAEKFVLRGEDGLDNSKTFKEYATKRIRMECPKASDVLLDRFSNAVLLRRKRFEFSRRHQSKLDVLGLASTATRAHQVAPMTASPSRTTIQMRSPSGLLSEARPRKPNAELLSTTTVSQMPTLSRWPDILETGTATYTAVRDPSVWASALKIPPPPKLPSLAKEFQCPYCFMVLSSDQVTSKKWIDHVLKDVEPYGCVFDNCNCGSVIYPNRQSWVSHLRDHKIVWRCNFAEHHSLEFTSSDAYEAHIETDHTHGANAPSKTQIPFLRRLAERKADNPLDACPFCPIDLSESEPLLEHVERHLRSIALMSLTWRDDVDEDQDNSNSKISSSKDSESAEDLNSLSKEFQDVGSISRPGDEEDLILFERPTTSEGANLDEEWGFIQLPNYYSGHELDPILQRFMREVYLGLTTPSLESFSARGVALPCFIMPPTNDRGCLGRESVIAQLEQNLCPAVQQSSPSPPNSGELRVFALCGPGGMGKTSVAREFVQRYRDRFDAVLWVHGDSRIKLLQDFRKIATKLGLIAKDSVDANDQILTRDLVKRFLINPRKSHKRESRSTHELASWILIFDGVDSPDLLKEFWPYGGPGSMLITSRDPLPFQKVHELGPLEDAEAARLLLHLTGKKKSIEDKKSAIEVARRVGGFPLALTHMASIINKRQWSFSKFINAFEKREVTETTSPLEETHDVYNYQLASNWGLEDLKHGRVLLDILSMLDPDSISEPLLTTHIGRAWMSDYPSSIHEFKRAKIELLQSSLIFENRGSNNIFLHRLVMDVARMRMSPVRYRTVFLECTRIISSAWPYEDFTWRHGVERWSTCGRLYPHVQALLNLAGSIEVTEDDLGGHYEFARLLTDASWYHHERGGSDESVQNSSRAQKILETLSRKLAESAPGIDSTLNRNVHSTLAEIQHNIGCFATETNKPIEALKHHTEFNNLMVSEYPDAFPRRDMRLAISWNELGTARMLNDHWTSGEECFYKSISAIRALENFDPLQLSLPLVNLGLAYWLTNKSTEAAEVLLGGLGERENAFGKDDQDSFITGRFLHALGNVKSTQGYFNESFEYHRRALLQYKSTLGNNHHRTADLCVRVAFHHFRMRHYDLSLALLNQALKIYGERDIFSRERLRARYHRSKVYRNKNRLAEADAEAEWCLEKYREITGRRTKELSNSELDSVIVFWSR